MIFLIINIFQNKEVVMKKLNLLFSNLAIISTLLFILTFFTMLIPAIYYIVLILMVICTVGTVFILIPNFGSWWSRGATLTNFAEKFSALFPIFAGISIISAITSLVLLLLNKNDHNWPRIILSIIIIIFIVVALIIINFGGTK